MSWTLVAQISVLMLVASLCVAALRGPQNRDKR